MPVTASSLIGKARTILLDTAGVRSNDAELLGWLNDGQRDILLYKPNAYVKNVSVKLVAGTKQSLPSDGVQLIDVVRNMGTSGAVPGTPVRIVDRRTLDAQLPTWHQSTPSAVAKHYTYNVLDPKNYYVWPPQPNTNQGYVEMVYGALPTDATLTGFITVDEIYASPLIDYMLYRAFAKDSEYEADAQRPTQHMNAFITALTGKVKSEIGASPSAQASQSTE